MLRLNRNVLTFGLLALAAVLAWHPANWPALAPAKASSASINLLHRSGQTFITWTERADLAGERYRVYRYSQPITSGNLAQAQLLQEVYAGSGYFYANRYNRDSSGDWQYRYIERYVIEDLAAPIPVGTGLLVWTLSAVDFGGQLSGSGYYAVTVVTSGGSESLDPGYAAGPLLEQVGDPLPAELNIDVGERGHVYIQYMDLRQWNPTFHAPNPANQYLGLPSTSPTITQAIQYAYDYVVYEPGGEDQCPGELPEQLPAVLVLHGWGDNSYGPYLQDPDPWGGWCLYKIYPVDMNQTWWFGFARQHDYRQEGEPGAGDTIVNYTEQRLLRMVYDLERRPPSRPVDANRVYAYGHSMGASGTLALALRYPNVFAAAYASEPMTNYRTSGDGGGVDWRADVALKWGSPALNLPVSIAAPNHWADRLQAYNATGVWDWQNHQASLQLHQADDMVPLGMAHGTQDDVIEWTTQGRPVYQLLNASCQAWGGAVIDADHTWLSFQGLPPGLGGDPPFAGFQARRDETIPGFSHLSGNPPLPPASAGNYNLSIRWSASWDDWDGAPLDTLSQWRISLCAVSAEDPSQCNSALVQTVDVTPRRLQKFYVLPGAAYSWENRRVSDNGLVASGQITASASGLLTVPGFQVSGTGNRLLLRPAGTLPTPTPTQTLQPTPTQTLQPTPTRTPNPSPPRLWLPAVVK